MIHGKGDVVDIPTLRKGGSEWGTQGSGEDGPPDGRPGLIKAFWNDSPFRSVYPVRESIDAR